MKRTLFCLLLSSFILWGCTTNDVKKTEDNNTGTEQSTTDNKVTDSDNNVATPNVISNDTDSTPPSGVTKVKGKVQLFEGAYFDDKKFGGTMLNNYSEVVISNITDTSFDFTVYAVDQTKNERTIIFETNTAIFINDGQVAAFYGKDHTLTFTFPNYHGAYPIITDMMISGFKPLEGGTYVNNGIPGHEFG